MLTQTEKIRTAVFSIIFVMFFLNIAHASAYTYDRTPSGNGAYNEVTVIFSTSLAEFCEDPFETVVAWAPVLLKASDISNLTYTEIAPWQDCTTTNYQYTFSSTNEENIAKVTIAKKYALYETYDSYEIEGAYPWNTIFTLNAYTAPVILGGAYSFIDFNDITPSDMIASVQDGTQQTTGKTLPLIVLVGIPLAFLILLALVNFLQQSVKEDTRKRGKKAQDDFKKLFKEEKKEDFIYHSAKDLEFKREYGEKHL